MGLDFRGCYMTFKARWNVITVLLDCYEILLEHGHETATKELKLAHAGTSYPEVTCPFSSQQPDWGPQQNQYQPWVPLPADVIQTTESPQPDPSVHALTAEAQSSEGRHEPSLPWGQNFWDTDCEDSKVLVYATEVLAWLLGGHSYGLCLLSELQIVRKRGGSNYNPSAPGRWIPCHEKNLLQTVGILFPCSLTESLASDQKPPHNSVFLSGDLGLISLKIISVFHFQPISHYLILAIHLGQVTLEILLLQKTFQLTYKSMTSPSGSNKAVKCWMTQCQYFLDYAFVVPR